MRRGVGQIVAALLLILVAIAGGMLIYNYLTSRSDAVGSKAEVYVVERKVYDGVAEIVLYNSGPSDACVVGIMIDGVPPSQLSSITVNGVPLNSFSTGRCGTIPVGRAILLRFQNLPAGHLVIEITLSDGSTIQIPIQSVGGTPAGGGTLISF